MAILNPKEEQVIAEDETQYQARKKAKEARYNRDKNSNGVFPHEELIDLANQNSREWTGRLLQRVYSMDDTEFDQFCEAVEEISDELSEYDEFEIAPETIEEVIAVVNKKGVEYYYDISIDGYMHGTVEAKSNALSEYKRRFENGRTNTNTHRRAQNARENAERDYGNSYRAGQPVGSVGYGGVVGGTQGRNQTGDFEREASFAAEESDISAEYLEEFGNGDLTQYSIRVKDKKTLDFLNGQETVKTYKSMLLDDGKLYPPMAVKVDGKYVAPSELGTWERAEERPDLIKIDKKTGEPKFYLVKENGKRVSAAYNPYQARKGVDEETGKPVYESNFPKGTPKSAKANRILSLIQDVWSKKSITLVVHEPGKLPRKIQANFDPYYEENTISDASKINHISFQIIIICDHVTTSQMVYNIFCIIARKDIDFLSCVTAVLDQL